MHAMHDALIECAADLFRLIALGNGESSEANDLRDLIRYYFGEMSKKEKDQILRDVHKMRWAGIWKQA